VNWLHAPWRHDWVTGAGGDGGPSREDGGCLFCRAWERPADDAANLVVARGAVLVMLNRYPYNGGHSMIAPREHVGTLEELPAASRSALLDAAARCCAAMRRIWQPDGFNIGLNIGRLAGAGIPDHLHLHVVPRWGGDTNFMTTAAATRVVSTDLERTAAELRAALAPDQPSQR